MTFREFKAHNDLKEVDKWLDQKEIELEESKLTVDQDDLHKI